MFDSHFSSNNSNAAQYISVVNIYIYIDNIHIETVSVKKN